MEANFTTLISFPRLIPVHSSHLLCAHNQDLHRFLPSATTFPKSAPYQKFASYYNFLLFSTTVTSSHRTICSSSLPCWAVFGIWNLTAEVTSPPWPLSRSQWLQLVCSALLRNQIHTCEWGQLRALTPSLHLAHLLTLGASQDTEVSCYLVVEHLTQGLTSDSGFWLLS